MRIILLVLLFSAQTTLAQAKDLDGEYAVFSLGGQNCNAYLKARRGSGASQRLYLEWMQGYLSAVNLLMPGTYNILGQQDFNQVLTWLDEHCIKQPQDLFITAATLLTANLYPVRLNLAPNKNNADKWSGNVPIPSN